MYDDRLFIDLARHILNGDWLGPYDHRTLAKGPFYPMWIAAVFKSGVPLLLAQHLLYIMACLIFVIAVKPLLQRQFIVLPVFVVLVFNPMSYTTSVMTQVLREGIYPALSVLVISFAAGLLIRYHRGLITLVIWSFGLGISMSAFWLTREEGIWLMPSVLVLITFAVVRALRTRPVDLSRIAIYALPFAVWLIILGSVAGINKTRYGTFTTVEFKSPDFLAAYGALSRVKHKAWKPAMPLPLEVRNRIYEVSPAFSELKPFMEGDSGKIWRHWLDPLREQYHNNPEIAKKMDAYLEKDPSGTWKDVFFNYEDDIIGGWFMWAFREAVAAAHYHTSGSVAAGYYRRLAKEVNAACSDGRLACGAERATMMPPWHNEYIYPFLKSVLGGVVFFSRFDDFDMVPSSSQGDEKSLKVFQDITRERLSPLPFQLKGWAFSPNSDINISIRSANGNSVRLVTFLDSEDVYQHVLSKGENLPQARKARFDILDGRTGDYSFCKEMCYLQIENSKRRIALIPLDGNIKYLDTNEVRLNIETLNAIHGSLVDKYKLHILSWIAKIYQYAAPFLAGVALIVYILATVKLIRKQAPVVLWLVNGALFIAIIVRLLMLSIINVTSFPGITVQYLSPAYPLLLMFVCLNLVTYWIPSLR